jgi:alginate O-acetyltransferase complex protein AlgI
MNRIEQLFLIPEKPLLFTQLNFWLFFMLVFIVFAGLAKLQKKTYLKSIFLTVVSLFFYFKTSGVFTLLLMISIILNHFFGKRIAASENLKAKKSWLILACTINIAVLAYFKYGYFFTESFNHLFQTQYHFVNYFLQWSNYSFGSTYISVDKMILPIGISFFTFQSIAYLIDIYRKTCPRITSFFDYAFFITFFPKLLMGPLVKANEFVSQMYTPYSLEKNDFGQALVLIAKGLIKKIVFADFIGAQFIEKIVADPEAFPGFLSVVAMWAYSLQIYADFSGYTDIATGIARLFGFQFPSNFNSPYKATSVADFWRRWHRTLGAWWREYLYIPLGGNKGGSAGTYICLCVIAVFLFFITGWVDLLYIYSAIAFVYVLLYQYVPAFQKVAFRDMNLLIVMIFGGIWHGASLNFVIWGTLNGLALVLFNYWKTISPYENSLAKGTRVFKILLTFNFISFTRIWFIMQENEQPYVFLNNIKNHFDLTLEYLGTTLTTFWVPLSVVGLGLLIHWLSGNFKYKIYEKFIKIPFVGQALSFSVLIVLLYQIAAKGAGGFAYFKF